MVARQINIAGSACWRLLKATRAVAFALVIALLALPVAADPPKAQEGRVAECRTDADCKLIYSSCSCVAVPEQDPRTFLPANIDCAVNRCRMEKIVPTCISQVCEPASKDPPRTSGGAARFGSRPGQP